MAQFALLSNVAVSANTTVIGNTVQGCGYYLSSVSSQTVNYSNVSLFVGSAQLQGSLVHNPQDMDWVDLGTLFQSSTVTNTVNGVETTTTVPFSSTAGTFTARGRFVTLRAVLTGYTAGTIDSIQVVY